ncbi:hypothetical protein LCGC14_2059270 [marine sediment metagenome]|uniref:Uncharacterized protein n=1 Tax=marine sediment metagenome TaxID=412755 RepID=A0A0F9H063_9ZZZZ
MSEIKKCHSSDEEITRQEEKQAKMLANFQWGDDDEGTEIIVGLDVVNQIMECVYELVEKTEKEISLKYFEGNSFSVPLSFYSHELLEKCFNPVFSADSRATFLECIYMAYAGVTNSIHFKEVLEDKINSLLPCEDTKYKFAIVDISLVDNPECPIQDLEGMDEDIVQDDFQSIISEINLISVLVSD